MRSDRITIGTVLLLGLTIVVLWKSRVGPFAQHCEPVANRPLRVGITPWVGFGGGILFNGGYRSSDTNHTRWANKLRVIFVNPDTLPSREVALGGSGGSACDGVDVLWSSLPTWAAEYPQFRAHGAKARVIAAIARSSSLHVLSTASPSSLDQLRDSVLATPTFLPAHWLATLNGLKKFNFINSYDNAIAPGDILAISEPDVYKVVQHPGAQYLRAIDSKTDVIYILVAREEAIENASMTLQVFVKDWLQGNRELQTKKEELVAYLRDIPGQVSISANQLEAELEHVHLASEEDNMTLFESTKPKESFDWKFYDANKNWGPLTTPVSSEEAKAGKLIRAINSNSSPSISADKALCEPNANVTTKASLTILFDPPGSSEVLPQFMDDLNTAAFYLKTQPATQACIVGHTDNTGIEVGNIGLSHKRADAVAEALRSPTVGQERMIRDWRGSQEPVANNTSRGGQRSNRRTEITIVAAKGADEEISYSPQNNRRVVGKVK